ncbi:DUF4126 domain-containing protein [Demetria terragena]|uniref:DUF4126 domain-containing protein n=1 Tax=Demetria terragena TaxID=63959 RepID=UPI000369D383|nr:DUF4126 domain-containing protein [Demetria terragena]
MFAALTGAGLSAAAGLNAYIPFLMVALVARFSDIIVLPTSLEWIESPWAIGAAALLLVTDVVLDKIPAIDSMNDMIGTAIRPTVGGIVFAATSAVDEQIDQSSLLTAHPWVGAIGGVIIAGFVHTTKAASRPAVNVGTAGVGGPVLSVAEDATAIAMSVIAVFIPLLVIVVLIVMLVASVWLWQRIARLRRRRRTGAYA